jgi:hypothetical protein
MKLKDAYGFKNNIRQLKEIYAEMSTIGNNIPPEGSFTDACRYINEQVEEQYKNMERVMFYSMMFGKGMVKIEHAECSHNWKRYVGFVESYYYCVNCDVKR